ncbi:MAG: hypothetical protein Q4A62_09145 [Eikenella sp.]|nr:hypothetical protein [Eikenella sp.]
MITVLPDYLRLFGACLPADEHDFLHLQTKRERPAAEDAGLAVSWDQLGGRLHAWENWLQRHPDSPRQAEAACCRMSNSLGRHLPKPSPKAIPPA